MSNITIVGVNGDRYSRSRTGRDSKNGGGNLKNGGGDSKNGGGDLGIGSTGSGQIDINMIPGPPGPQGCAGRKGQAGSHGVGGSSGLRGPPGEIGLIGPPGFGLPGSAGPPGPMGRVGLPGPPGSDGMIGIEGERGMQGPLGKQGIVGNPGNTGATGHQGVAVNLEDICIFIEASNERCGEPESGPTKVCSCDNLRFWSRGGIDIDVRRDDIGALVNLEMDNIIVGNGSPQGFPEDRTRAVIYHDTENGQLWIWDPNDGLVGSWTNKNLDGIDQSAFKSCGVTGAIFITNRPDSWVSIGPTGTGFLSATPPNYTVEGGGCRGSGAVDWQIKRSVTFQIASGDRSFIGGGRRNQTNALYAIVGSGFANRANATGAMIGGGSNNFSKALYSVIMAGACNQNNGNFSVIGGGVGNFIGKTGAFIGGGSRNEAIGVNAGIIGGFGGVANDYSFVGGGKNNYAFYRYGVILGGQNNAELADRTVIIGGLYNMAVAEDSIIGGGARHTVYGSAGSVFTGYCNLVSGVNSAIFSGNQNETRTNQNVILAGCYNLTRGNHGGIGSGQCNLVAGINSVVISGRCNRTLGTNTFIGSGIGNTAGGSGTGAFVGAGLHNWAYGVNSSIVGGSGNLISATGGFVGAGRANQIEGEQSAILSGGINTIGGGKYSAIGGGLANRIDGNFNIIFNGRCNLIENISDFGVIGAGDSNQITKGSFCGILTGQCNTIKTQDRVVIQADGYSTILGGKDGYISGNYSLIGGGSGNTVSGAFSVIVNGLENSIDVGGDNYSVAYAKILGGQNNLIKAPENRDMKFATIFSGKDNLIEASTIRPRTRATKALIWGGQCNKILSSPESIVGGGFKNVIGGTGYSNRNVILGGKLNTITTSSATTDDADNNFIGGGSSNSIIGSASSIVAGQDNSEIAYYSFIGSGKSNQIDLQSISSYYLNPRATILTGICNKISGNGYGSFIGQGINNLVNGKYSTVVAGQTNVIGSGESYALCGVNREANIGGTNNKYSTILNGKSTINTNNGIGMTIINGFDSSIQGDNLKHILMLNTKECYVRGSGHEKLSILNCANSGFSGVNIKHSTIVNGKCNLITGDNSFCSIISGKSNLISETSQHSTIGVGLNLNLVGNHNFIGGGNANTIANQFNFIGNGVCNSILNGSGYSQICNGVNNVLGPSGSFSTIGSGKDNYLNTRETFLGGGSNNRVIGNGLAFLGGGHCNTIETFRGVLFGGKFNSILGLSSDSDLNSHNMIGGGVENLIDTATGVSQFNVILGGYRNNILGGGTGGVNFNFIGGGVCNSISGEAYSAICGGWSNSIIDSRFGFIGGGKNQTVSGNISCIVGGLCNFVGLESGLTGSKIEGMFIGGGKCNRVLSSFACIAGGSGNLINSSGTGAFIGGGRRNTVSKAFSNIVGGSGNLCRDTGSFIGSGHANSLTGNEGIILGGWCNQVVTGANSVILSGFRNIIGTDSRIYFNDQERGVIISGKCNLVEGEAGFIASGLGNQVYGLGMGIMSGSENQMVRMMTKAGRDLNIVTKELKVYYRADNVDGFGNPGVTGATGMVNLVNPGVHDGVILNSGSATFVEDTGEVLGTPFRHYIEFSSGDNTYIDLDNHQVQGGVATASDATWEYWLSTESGASTVQMLYGEFSDDNPLTNEVRHIVILENVGLASGNDLTYDHFPPGGFSLNLNPNLSHNTYIQIVVTKKDDLVSVYQNGVLVTTGLFNDTLGAYSGSLPTTHTWIGRNDFLPSWHFVGRMSLVRLYDCALTASEILQNYVAEIKPVLPSNVLDSYLDQFVAEGRSIIMGGANNLIDESANSVIIGGLENRIDRNLVEFFNTDGGFLIPSSGTIGQASPHPSVIFVNRTGIIRNLVVNLENISSVKPFQIEVVLESPNGSVIILMKNNGGVNTIANVDLTFDDASSLSLGVTTILSGIYKPTAGTVIDNTGIPVPAPNMVTTQTLSGFIGEEMFGPWKLYIYDPEQGGASATIDGWSLGIVRADGVNDTHYSFIGGGYSNLIEIDSSGQCRQDNKGHAMIFGGQCNVVEGFYGFAGGAEAEANHDGCFVFADNTGGSYGTTGAGQFRVRASDGAHFSDSLTIGGDFTAGGLKSFEIDHPLGGLGEKRMKLRHNIVESPEVLNMYRGRVVLDANGEAEVEVDDWLTVINREFHYLLIPIGGACPNLHIAKGLDYLGNRFKIGGGVAGVKVSWQVTGIRSDLNILERPFIIEVV